MRESLNIIRTPPSLPDGANPIFDGSGNIVGFEMNGLRVEDDDFNAETIQALQQVLEHPNTPEEVIESIIPHTSSYDVI